jgi:hypothetical protein
VEEVGEDVTLDLRLAGEGGGVHADDPRREVQLVAVVVEVVAEAPAAAPPPQPRPGALAPIRSAALGEQYADAGQRPILARHGHLARDGVQQPLVLVARKLALPVREDEAADEAGEEIPVLRRVPAAQERGEAGGRGDVRPAGRPHGHGQAKLAVHDEDAGRGVAQREQRRRRQQRGLARGRGAEHERVAEVFGALRRSTLDVPQEVGGDPTSLLRAAK